jgi:hypothetical protein
MNKHILIWPLVAILILITPSMSLASQESQAIEVPLLGAVDLESASMLITTITIGFVDGLNPYSLWGLVFLLGIITAAGSKKKALVVGLTYLTVVALVYGIMMIGMVNVFSQWGYQNFIRTFVALVAMGFALLNIYGYFNQKTEATIVSTKKQSRFKERIIRVMNPHNGLGTLISGTAVVAMGITILEFPLTFSLPMIWTNIMARYQINFVAFLALLLLYLLVYLIDEIVIMASTIFALKKAGLSYGKEQALKLIGGVIVLTLAVALILDLEIINTLGGSLGIFAFALLVSLAIIALCPVKLKKKTNES